MFRLPRVAHPMDRFSSGMQPQVSAPKGGANLAHQVRAVVESQSSVTCAEDWGTWEF